MSDSYMEMTEVNRLARAIDVALCGDGAASQASLCDLVKVAERKAADLARVTAERDLAKSMHDVAVQQRDRNQRELNLLLEGVRELRDDAQFMAGAANNKAAFHLNIRVRNQLTNLLARVEGEQE